MTENILKAYCRNNLPHAHYEIAELKVTRDTRINKSLEESLVTFFYAGKNLRHLRYVVFDWPLLESGTPKDYLSLLG